MLALLLPLPLLLAGCVEAAAQAPLAPAEGLAPDQLYAGFPPGGVADLIEVDSVGRLPLHSAELIAPDGTVTPANSLNATDSPHFSAGQFAVNDPWRTGLASGLAGGPTTPSIASGQPGAALRGDLRLSAIASTASIPLPDPQAYRRDWQHYRIRLGFGIPPSPIELHELAAPAPPPSAAAP